MLPPEIIKSGLMTSLATILFPDSEEKQYGVSQFKAVKNKAAYRCSNDHRPPCLQNCV